MDDRTTVDVDVVDEFERLGRLAGAELRQPPPADGASAVLRSAHRRRTTTAVVAAGVTVAVVATGLFVTSSRFEDGSTPVATVPPSPAPPVPTEPSSPAPVESLTPTSVPSVVEAGPFLGVWVSVDTDGSSQTMGISRSEPDEYDVVIQDEAATAACSGGASTLTGVGRLEADTSLVMAQPELTCDAGTIPSIGLAPQAELANFTLELDTATGEVVDTFGVVWQRAGSNDEPIEPLPVTATAEQSPSAEMWPQSTVDEVEAAQQLADAGDPDYTWQLEPELVNYYEAEEPGEVELVDRFLRQVLGWEGYMWRGSGQGTARNGVYTDLLDQQYLRCAPGRTNPMYPPGPEPVTDDEILARLRRGDLCAPTIDDLTYETVSLDLTQPAGRGPDGIWVVNEWDPAAPFVQADPAVVEAQGRERMEEFLAARVAGDGADRSLRGDDASDVPLLYATTSGAPYERYEIELVGRPRWPDALMTFSAKLFTAGETTVVEQQFSWVPKFGLWPANHETTENGQPVVTPFSSPDGEVTLTAPDSWTGGLAGKTWDGRDQDMWIGSLSRREDLLGPHERIELVDPVAYDAWCADNGGNPLLTAPADAAEIAQQLIDDPDFETTAPVAVRVGGMEAVSIDVGLAPGGKACGVGMIGIPRWIHTIGWDPGWRLRLYLVDLPDGMSVETLAITVVAHEDRFDAFVAETAPIIDSIEFHPA